MKSDKMQPGRSPFCILTAGEEWFKFDKSNILDNINEKEKGIKF